MFSNDRFVPLREFDQDKLRNTQGLFSDEVATKAALERRPGVKSVKVSLLETR